MPNFAVAMNDGSVITGEMLLRGVAVVINHYLYNKSNTTLS